MQTQSAVRAVLLKDDGIIPNNPKLPLLIYKEALELPEQHPAPYVEQLLSSHQWGGAWRNGIYAYHHYHSTAHEVLVIYRGSADVQLGGEQGIRESIRAGDVLLIPAGVGHRKLDSSKDFAVVGAYPAGQDWDICYGKVSERPRADKNIERVPLPVADPIYGELGPMSQHWRR